MTAGAICCSEVAIACSLIHSCWTFHRPANLSQLQNPVAAMPNRARILIIVGDFVEDYEVLLPVGEVAEAWEGVASVSQPSTALGTW